MTMQKGKTVVRCCGNCRHGVLRKVPEKSNSPKYAEALTFNKYSRGCGRIGDGSRVYRAWERNKCGQFEERDDEG